MSAATYDKHDVAQALGCSPASAVRLMSKGRLGAERGTGSNAEWRAPVSSIQRLLDERAERVEQAAQAAKQRAEQHREYAAARATMERVGSQLRAPARR